MVEEIKRTGIWLQRDCRGPEKLGKVVSRFCPWAECFLPAASVLPRLQCVGLAGVANFHLRWPPTLRRQTPNLSSSLPALAPHLLARPTTSTANLILSRCHSIADLAAPRALAAANLFITGRIPTIARPLSQRKPPIPHLFNTSRPRPTALPLELGFACSALPN